jgi:1-hydroxy-2-naphthoate dioxygenase
MQTIKTLPEFNALLAENHVGGQWQAEPMLQAAKQGPAPRGVPYLWKWDLVYKLLLEACEVFPESLTARRNINFVNPAFKTGFGTTHTLVSGVQMVLPGEIAWSHRHTLGALRFGIEGSRKLYTVVDGEPLAMEPNDLVLTPNWNWHDHHNDSDRAGIWLDVLDAPLIAGGLNQTFYEELGDVSQPSRDNPGEFVSDRVGLVRPAGERRPVHNYPLRYAWSDVQPMLERMRHAAINPYDGTMLEYINPMTGGSTLPTIACYIQSLPVGFAGKPHRQSSSTLYYVVEGSGTTVVDGVELNWSERDNFVVPNWAQHQHANTGAKPAVLFASSDRPVLDFLGLYREDPDATVATPLPAVPANRLR